MYVKIDVDEKGMGVLESSHLEEIRAHFSFENPDRKHASPYAKRHIPKLMYAISGEGKFHIGLLNEIFDYVKKVNPNISSENFQVTSRAKYYYEPSFLLPENYDLFSFSKYGYDYRDIQETALSAILRRGRGIIEVGTAGGKGLIMASICRTLESYNPSTTFVIMLPTHLVMKTVKEFVKSYGYEEGTEISAWDGDNLINPQSKIIVAGQHILNSKTQSDNFEKYILNRSVCLIDECHIVKRKSVLSKRLNAMQTNNIIGLTGSLPKPIEDKLNVLGMVGKIVCKIKSREIKDKGLKADSKVVAICLDGVGFVNPEREPKKAFDAEKLFLLENKARNEFIRDWVLKACDGNTLIPVDLDIHEQILVEYYRDCGRTIYVINGKTPKKERARIYDQMEVETNAILIVKTGIMREGISISNLSYLVGYFIQKSFIKIVQLLGRIERHGGNEIPIFFDIWDTTTFSKKHHKQRLEIYKEEQLDVIKKTIPFEYN